MNTVCSINSQALETLLQKLDEKTRREVLMKGLSAGAQKLKAGTLQELRKKVPSADATKKWKKPMTSGVRVIKEGDYLTAVVSIMKDFRLKWFEKGTKERYTAKRAFRGRIAAEGFFAAARSDDAEIERAITSAIKRELDRI